MNRQFCMLALAGLLSGGAALAQQTPPASTPSTFPQDQTKTMPRSTPPPNRGDEDWPGSRSGSATQQSTTNPEGAMTPESPQGDQTTPAPQSSPRTSAAPNATPSPQTTLPQGDQSPKDLQGKIQSAIQQDPSLSGTSISVSVTADGVELTGTAPSARAKKTAQDIAKTNAGGRRVINNVKLSASDTTVPR
ncbi:MAG TPA: BON domain-containing protein [Terriglobales bacterium]|nr:BON domain-containing protein [Terriglobales bacterium]